MLHCDILMAETTIQEAIDLLSLSGATRRVQDVAYRARPRIGLRVPLQLGLHTKALVAFRSLEKMGCVYPARDSAD